MVVVAAMARPPVCGTGSDPKDSSLYDREHTTFLYTRGHGRIPNWTLTEPPCYTAPCTLTLYSYAHAASRTLAMRRPQFHACIRARGGPSRGSRGDRVGSVGGGAVVPGQMVDRHLLELLVVERLVLEHALGQ